jgi:hypothetical protein
VQLTNDLPIYSFILDVNYDKDKLYSEIVSEFKSQEMQDYLTSSSNNFKLDKKYDFVNELYEKFFQESTKLFGDLVLEPTNIKDGWAYINNKDFYKNGIHNHLKTSTINSVYYLNVPDKTTGSINFFNDGHDIIYTHHPKEKELIIFPNYMLHEPCQSMTDEYRIAVNLEIKCQNIWSL